MNKIEEVILLERDDNNLTILTKKLIYSGNTSDIYSDLIKKNIDFGQVRTVYIDKECAIPRYKFKDFSKSHGVSIIRDRSKADIIIINQSTINNYIKHTYEYRIDRVDFINYLRKMGQTLISNHQILEIEQSIHSYIYVDYHISNWLAKELLKQKVISQSQYDEDIISTSESILEVTDITYLTQIITPGNNIYSENNLLKSLNVGPTIDIIMYNQLKDMIKSEDHENTIVAMEIMANSNYDQSIVYLLLLFREFFREDFRGLKETNHVNFKSLKKYLSVKNLYNISLDNITDILMEKDLLTRANINILLDLAYMEHKEGADTEYFKVTKVELPSEILAKVIEPKLPTPNFKPLSDKVCIEKSESGDCLMSVQYVELDLGKEPGSVDGVNHNL